MAKGVAWFALALCLLLGLGALGLQSVGMSPINLSTNIAVGTGMGSKLACSARFLSGLVEDQIREDLATYSPANDWFTITLARDLHRASVDLLGLFRASATYRPGIGCTLDQTDMSSLDNLKPPSAPAVDESRL